MGGVTALVDAVQKYGSTRKRKQKQQQQQQQRRNNTEDIDLSFLQVQGTICAAIYDEDVLTSICQDDAKRGHHVEELSNQRVT